MIRKSTWVSWVCGIWICAAAIIVASGPAAALQSACLVAPAADDAFAYSRQRAQRLIETHRDLVGVPGIAASVGTADAVIWNGVTGYADHEAGVPVTETTRFRIGSVSKVLTAVAVARLYERGLIDVDAPIERYVPGFPDKEHAITIRQLGGHLSGIRHYATAEEVNNRTFYANIVHSLEAFQDDPLLFRPGQAHAYSSYGFQLIAAALEGATGLPFDEVVAREVLGPAGMLNTAVEDGGIPLPGQSRSYAVDRDGSVRSAPEIDLSDRAAGGGFVSTSADLVRLGQALLGDRLIGDRGQTLLFTRQRTSDGNAVVHGFGFEVYHDPDGRQVYGHGGSVAGGRAHLILYPEQQLVLGFTANSSQGIGFNQGEAIGLAELFLPERRSAGTLDRERLGAYRYRTIRDESEVGGEARTEEGVLIIYTKCGDYRGLILNSSGSATEIPVLHAENDRAWGIAVPGSWRFLYLRWEEGGLTGEWVERGTIEGRFWFRGRYHEVEKLF